jgi:RHS repeat-associated protein
VAVVAAANSAAPVLYWVHADHLGRPARMMNASGVAVWDVIYAPFGGTAWIADATAKLDMRFPGQWFQMESGLAYNWHRHYDATLGRYVQPDPLRVDEKEGVTVGGITNSVQIDNGFVRGTFLQRGLGAQAFVPPANFSRRANFTDGPNPYPYAALSPLVQTDPLGLQAFSPDQAALVNLCKCAKASGASNAEADILLAWAQSYGLRCRDDRDTTHWIGGPHIHIGPVNHIPVK